MSNILFFDTETTGKFDYKAGPFDKHQPDLVQLAALLTDSKVERVLGQINLIVKPETFVISKEVTAIHGISHELALAVGVPVKTVLSAFNWLCEGAEILVAHNFEFDDSIMKLAYQRINQPHRMSAKVHYCTMKAATPILKLPKAWKATPEDPYKWPNLQECHEHFLGKRFEGAHDAMQDVMATARVYKEMNK